MTMTTPAPGTPAALDAQLSALADEATAILDNADSKGRECTPAESRRIYDIFDESKETRRARDKAAKRIELRSQLGGLTGQDTKPILGIGGRGWADGDPAVWAKSTADRIVDHHGGSRGFKAITQAGSIVTQVPAPPVVAEGQPAPSVLALVPTQPTTAEVIPVLVQTLRELNAAIVQIGAVKPTSRFGLERVEHRVQVVAHVTEAIDRFLLADSTAIEQFIRTELGFGIRQAVEAEVVTGDGTTGHFAGLLNVTGSNSQAFDTDAPTSIRRALTVLENLGLAANGIVMNPTDFADVELALASTEATSMAGLGAPIQPVERRLWGVRVALSPAMPSGRAVVADFAGTALYQRDDLLIDWTGTHSDDYVKNAVRFRAETRSAFAVLRPSGIVDVDLGGNGAGA